MHGGWGFALPSGGALDLMKHVPFDTLIESAAPIEAEQEVTRLKRQLARERAARLEAEAIAERGLRELYESQRLLMLLHRITDGANQANDISAAMEFAVREICHHMGWDFGNAYVVSRETGEAIASECWFAANPTGLFPFVEASRRARFRRGQGLPGRVMRDLRPHWIDDVREDDGFLRRQVAAECALISACAFPISFADEVVAIVEFFSHRQLEDKEAIVNIMGQIGTQLGRVVERDRARQVLLHDAMHDSLTGLANRQLLAHRAHDAFALLPESRHGLAMVVIDLDGFKSVNDRHGHHGGDALLKQVSKRLQDSLDALKYTYSSARRCIDATLGRTGGDEFVVLISGGPVIDLCNCLSSAIHDTLRRPFTLEGETVSVGASVGIAVSGPQHQDWDEVLRDADLAMYAAKAKGRGTTVEFTDDLGSVIRKRAALENELREAIRLRQFVLHYQPIIDMSQASTIRGYEALVRWQHPERGLLPPAEFIETAEESGLIIFIGDWVLQEACAAMKRFHDRLPRNRWPFVSINIAPQQFLQPNFVARVQDVLMATGIDPTMVRLEVTEGVAILDATRTAKVLNEIREWGVRTSLDDFGTGYSSLSYLQKLPFDTLKIDRSFVAAIEDKRSRHIIHTILDLARAMDMSVVAEGIELEHQQSVLTNMGCGFGQGYLYGKPADEEAAFAMVAGDDGVTPGE